MYSTVHVVYIARGKMILIRTYPFRRQLEGVGPENRDFFSPIPSLLHVVSFACSVLAVASSAEYSFGYAFPPPALG